MCLQASHRAVCLYSLKHFSTPNRVLCARLSYVIVIHASGVDVFHIYDGSNCHFKGEYVHNLITIIIIIAIIIVVVGWTGPSHLF